MEPRIQYTTTSDGVRIAYCTYGQGPFLVMPPPALPFSHIEMEFVAAPIVLMALR